MRLLIWVQNILGTGHLRRALRLAGACADAGAEVTVASGGPRIPWPDPAGVSLVQLPAIVAADKRGSVLVDTAGNPVTDALWAARRAVLLDALAGIRPDIVVTEMYPFGRNAFHVEVQGLLAAARDRCRPAVVASVRDVLVTKLDASKVERNLRRFEATYDQVLVHGDPELIPFSTSFPPASRLGDRLLYTGYLTGSPAAAARATRFGARLLETAITAHALSAARALPLRVVTGLAMADDDVDRLSRRAGPAVRIDRHHDDLMTLLPDAAVSVSQAGYNTVAEALATATPMVLVPFADAGEDEEAIRARRLAERGMAEVVEPQALSPEVLAGAIDRALARRAPQPPAMDGAARSAQLLATIVQARHAA